MSDGLDTEVAVMMFVAAILLSLWGYGVHRAIQRKHTSRYIWDHLLRTMGRLGVDPEVHWNIRGHVDPAKGRGYLTWEDQDGVHRVDFTLRNRQEVDVHELTTGDENR